MESVRDRATHALTILAVICAFAGSSHASTFVIAQDGSGHFLTIQEGIDAASYGDTVLVCPGTYEEFLLIDADDDGVALLSVAGPSSTVLQGSFSGYTLVRIRYVGPDMRLQGFTLRDNRYGAGGAIYCQNSACPRIEGNYFVNNNGGDAGGAIICVQNASPSIVENTFVENVAAWGGAIDISPGSVVEIRGNTFERNTAQWFGGSSGGAICVWGTTAMITGNVFRQNFAATQGGAILAHEADLVIEGNLFESNEGDWGGAICLETGGTCEIRGNTFSGNRALDWGASGGAISCIDGVSLEVTDNVFFDNVASVGRSVAFTEPTGSISFTHCAFLGDQSYEVEVTAAAAASTLSFRECWWETTSPESIGTLIWDCSDDPALNACVDFSNWCTDPACAGQATSVPDETQPQSVTWGTIKSWFR